MERWNKIETLNAKLDSIVRSVPQSFESHKPMDSIEFIAALGHACEIATIHHGCECAWSRIVRTVEQGRKHGYHNYPTAVNAVRSLTRYGIAERNARFLLGMVSYGD